MTTSVRSEVNRSVIAVDGVDRLAINGDGSLELLTPATNPTGNDIPTAGQLPFTKSYVSAEQTIVAGGGLTLPHGLGVTPTLYRCVAICKIAEAGYAVGDILEVPSTTDVSDSLGMWRGVSLVGNITNISIRYVANNPTFVFVHKDTGVAIPLTSTCWRLIVRAWA